MGRWAGAVAAVAAGAVALAGCSAGTVVVGGRPAVGAVAVYRVEAHSVTTTAIAGQAARRTVADAVVTARHRVLEASAAGTVVEVRVTREGAPAATVVVRFDRRSRRTSVERAEGLAADALGEVGLAELFPSAAAAPPTRALAPGARWRLGAPVALGDSSGRLSGQGRLVALGVAGGRELAQVATSYRVPVRRAAAAGTGQVVLDGTLATTARVSYDLGDDQVHAVRARTAGRYAVTLLPPPGVAGEPVSGTLDVEVTSSSRRVG